MKTSDLVKRLVKINQDSTAALQQLAADVAADEVVVVPPVVTPPVITPPVEPPVVVPPVVVPPVVTPPATGKQNLYVKDGKLLSKTGAPIVLRGIESMYGPSSAGDPVKFMQTNKTLGANGIGPLVQQTQAGSIGVWHELLEESRKAGLICALNFDHTGDGRATLKRPDLVELISQYDHVILQNEIELGESGDQAGWANDAIAYVKEVRAAGYLKQPIKVGSPLGGRQLKFPLAKGKQVLDADPEKNVIFTAQMYWGTKTSGWTYNTDNGFSYGRQGLIEACQAVANSGLCIVLGLDYKDDIGDTGMDTLMTECGRLGIGYQYWALSVGDPYGNGMLSQAWNVNSITPAGALVKADFVKTSVLADLG